MPPDPPSVFAPFGAQDYFCQTNFELLPPALLLPLGNTQYNITYLMYTKRCFFSQQKKVHLLYYTDICISSTTDMRSAQA